MHPIEDDLSFKLECWFEISGSGSSGPIPYITGNYYLKFECDTAEEITVNAFDYIMSLDGTYVSKLYPGNVYLMERNSARPPFPEPNYFEYQGESTFQRLNWELPNDFGIHEYYTFHKYG